MILKPTQLGKVKALNSVKEVKPASSTSKSSARNTLPPDVYKPILPPKRILVREFKSSRNGTPVKQYLEVSVKRFDDDEASIHIWATMYIESEMYTGYMKGKNINFPLDALWDVVELFNETGDDCDEHDIYDMV